MFKHINRKIDSYKKSTASYTKCNNMLDYYIEGMERHNESISYAEKDRTNNQANDMLTNILDTKKASNLDTKLQKFNKLSDEGIKSDFTKATFEEFNVNKPLSKDYDTDISSALSVLLNSRSYNNLVVIKDENTSRVVLSEHQKTHAFTDAKKLLSDWIRKIESGKGLDDFNKDTIIYVNKFVNQLEDCVPENDFEKYYNEITKMQLNRFNTLSRNYIDKGIKHYEKYNVESPNFKTDITKRYLENKFEFSDYQKIYASEETKNLLSDWIRKMESPRPLANLNNATISHINNFVDQLSKYVPTYDYTKYNTEIVKLKNQFNTLAKDYVNKTNKNLKNRNSNDPEISL